MTSHASWIRETYALAVQAAQKGNHPFGALLVKDAEIVLAAENSVTTSGDLTRHAELNLVSRAAQELPGETIRQCTLYTSTEPCVMCTGAIYWAGIPAIVFGVSAEAFGRLVKEPFEIPCREILARGKSTIQVNGPVLEEEGLALHRRFWFFERED